MLRDRRDHVIDEGKVANSVTGGAQVADTARTQQTHQTGCPLGTAGSKHACRTQNHRIAAVIDVSLNDPLALDLRLSIATDWCDRRMIFPDRSNRRPYTAMLLR